MAQVDKSRCCVCAGSLAEQKTQIVDIYFKVRRCYVCQRLLDQARERRTA